jgi:type I restriction enzyme S subunit
MSEWRKCKLGELITLEYGKGLRDYREVSGKYEVFGTNGKIGFTGKYLHDKPSIIIGRKGAYRGVHLATNPFYVIDTAFYTKTKNESTDNIFLYFWLKDVDIDAMDSGSAIPSTSREEVYDLDIVLPPLPEQKAIASVLSSLNDKIDLLHRQNKTLEAIAETLFRQWFVEEAQDDWEDGCLGDFAVNVTKSAKISDIKSDDIYIGLEHIERRNISLIKAGSGGEVESNKYFFKKYDVLFGKLRPYFHKVCFAPFDGICSTDILVIRPKEKYLFWYCLFSFFQDDVVEYANLGSGGTRMPRTNWEMLSRYPVAIPEKNKLMQFNEAACSFVDKIEQNQKQIRTIEKLRDNLLPKLMSGEVRVNCE